MEYQTCLQGLGSRSLLAKVMFTLVTSQNFIFSHLKIQSQCRIAYQEGPKIPYILDLDSDLSSVHTLAYLLRSVKWSLDYWNKNSWTLKWPSLASNTLCENAPLERFKNCAQCLSKITYRVDLKLHTNYPLKICLKIGFEFVTFQL